QKAPGEGRKCTQLFRWSARGGGARKCSQLFPVEHEGGGGAEDQRRNRNVANTEPINKCAYAVSQAKASGGKNWSRPPCAVFIDGDGACGISGNDTTTSCIMSARSPFHLVDARGGGLSIVGVGSALLGGEVRRAGPHASCRM